MGAICIEQRSNAFHSRGLPYARNPRFMLVNPEGYLVNFKYTCPSDPQCAELIEQDMKDNK